jgi:hypothetical protein
MLPTEPTIEEVLGDWEDRPVNLNEEVPEIVGECLWDVFSDKHDVVAAYGRTVDIGSFRGAFLDEYLIGSNQQWDAGDARGGGGLGRWRHCAGG